MSRNKAKPKPPVKPKGGPSRRGAAKLKADNKNPEELSPHHRHVVGIHSVKEALRVRPGAIDALYVKPDWQSNNEIKGLVALAELGKVQVGERKEKFFNQLGSQHQGVCVPVSEKPNLDWSVIESDKDQIVLILDGIEDPHNLGAIMRTAWLMQVTAIFLPNIRAVQVTPTVMKVASGGAEHIPIVTCSNLSQQMQELKDNGFWIYGLDGTGDSDLWSLKFSGKVALVVGSEGRGMRKTTASKCDHLLKIQQSSDDASYNASVAASICIAEVRRQLQLS